MPKSFVVSVHPVLGPVSKTELKSGFAYVFLYVAVVFYKKLEAFYSVPMVSFLKRFLLLLSV